MELQEVLRPRNTQLVSWMVLLVFRVHSLWGLKGNELPASGCFSSFWEDSDTGRGVRDSWSFTL